MSLNPIPLVFLTSGLLAAFAMNRSVNCAYKFLGASNFHTAVKEWGALFYWKVLFMRDVSNLSLDKKLCLKKCRRYLILSFGVWLFTVFFMIYTEFFLQGKINL